jgi:hypothetical protein
MFVQVVIAHCAALILLVIGLQLWTPTDLMGGGRTQTVLTMLIFVFIPIAIGRSIISSRKKKKVGREERQAEEEPVMF